MLVFALPFWNHSARPLYLITTKIGELLLGQGDVDFKVEGAPVFCRASARLRLPTAARTPNLFPRRWRFKLRTIIDFFRFYEGQFSDG
jgi:hypothetical protein